MKLFRKKQEVKEIDETSLIKAFNEFRENIIIIDRIKKFNDKNIKLIFLWNGI